MDQQGKLWKTNGKRSPLAVIFEPSSRMTVLSQGHENLGHKGAKAVWEQLRVQFYWLHMQADERLSL
jgi:hypothetical protein